VYNLIKTVDFFLTWFSVQILVVMVRYLFVSYRFGLTRLDLRKKKMDITNAESRISMHRHSSVFIATIRSNKLVRAMRGQFQRRTLLIRLWLLSHV